RGAGVARLHAGKLTAYTTRDGLPSDVILSLAGTRNGDLWIGTPDGLSRWHNGAFTTLTTADGLPDDFIRSLHETADGNLWIGTRQGLTRRSRNSFTTFTTADGLPSNYIGALDDSAAGLWIATLDGLTLYDGNRFTTFPLDKTYGAITTLHAEKSGALWIGTSNGGLLQLRDGKLVRASSSAEFPQTISGIQEDDTHHLWLCTPQGIARVVLDDLQHAEWYGTSDGLSSRECSSDGHPATLAADDGSLWFANINGVAEVNPSRLPKTNVPPSVVIETVTANDRVLAPGVHDLAPDQNRIAFHFAGLSLAAPQLVRYEYKLEPFDRDWIPSTKRDASYTNLPARSYTFRVRAANRNGEWSQAAAEYAFSIRPHFYRTLWFYAICAFALAAIAWLAYRLRLRRLQSRFDLVLAERTRIARDIHDTLAQDFVGISVQLELVSRTLSQSIETAREHLDQARILVRQSVANARRSVWDLRNPSAADITLPDRLSALARTTPASVTRADFALHGTYRPLDPNTEEQVFRIAQEAFSNALRHSRAKHIGISLNYDLSSVTLAVRDDGTGFIPANASPNGHYGLVGMRERAQSIRSDLNVESAPGQGTTITVRTSAG
ncbi:MAG: hypothetical protein JOZ43_00625, partial [Acidobacteriales bacterium]|nr:hypothetical protein [Terriglobales bacterium]